MLAYILISISVLLTLVSWYGIWFKIKYLVLKEEFTNNDLINFIVLVAFSVVPILNVFIVGWAFQDQLEDWGSRKIFTKGK